MCMQRCVFLLGLLLVSISAQARLYTWVDPETGTKQMSGLPPAWYRSSEPGPHITVYENGRQIDDTSMETTVSERQRLRQQALIDLKRRQEEVARIKKEEKAMEEAEQEASMRKEPALPEEVSRIMVQLKEEEYIQQMKKIINEWDSKNPGAAAGKAADAGQAPQTPAPPAAGK